jgi:transcriptional regulator with XRE-family HTH domain
MPPQNIGLKIRKLREERGWSQTKVATLLDMGQQGYSCYETNIVPIPLVKFLKLCDIFAMSAEEIVAVNEHEDSTHATA